MEYDTLLLVCFVVLVSTGFLLSALALLLLARKK